MRLAQNLNDLRANTRMRLHFWHRRNHNKPGIAQALFTISLPSSVPAKSRHGRSGELNRKLVKQLSLVDTTHKVLRHLTRHFLDDLEVDLKRELGDDAHDYAVMGPVEAARTRSAMGSGWP